ncbi:unnamed protein product [Calypogeia fissa]
MEEDSLLMFLSMEKQRDVDSGRNEKPDQVVKGQLQTVKEEYEEEEVAKEAEAEGVVSSCPVFWICVAATLLVLSVLSGAYQFCPSPHRRSSVRTSFSSVDGHLTPVYEVPLRAANDQSLDGFFDESSFGNRVSHVDEYQGEAILHEGRAYLTSQHSSDEKGVVARPHSVGRLLHSQVLQMKHRGPKPGQESVASFQATFVFSIENSLAGREATGDGFAFVMVPEGNVMGSGGGSLGVMDLDKESHHTFAVEFDTWKNPSLHDISNNHVGVNVNSMVSVVAEEAGYWAPRDYRGGHGNVFRPLDLTSGKIQAWIDYDGMSQELTVGISPLLGYKPSKPLLRTSLDLSKVLNQYMSVGFSAATGDFAAKHVIHGWQFEVSSGTLQHWRIASNVDPEQVLPAATETSRKSQFFQNRGIPRDVSNLPVFRNPHKHRHSDMSRGEAVAATFLPALEVESEERVQISGMREHCAEFLPDFPKMDFASFNEHLVRNLLWILLGLASAVLFIHLLFIAYHILVGCYDTCVGSSDEALGIVYQRVLDESDDEADEGRYVLVVSESQQHQQSSLSETLPLDRV